ncbi:MAG: MaoC/PaaZ C-terminal domain-containing protein [Desulfobacteraceae bacterium]|nr:MaoC/PaaZ C-terminal domain-containing protein [Desulfobacteraceae bacterium]
MNLDKHLVGTTLQPYHAQISARDISNYAAAVEDTNPAYFDDEKKEGILSPPMMAVAVTWPVLSRLDKFIDSEDFPTEVLMTQVHYTEHLVLHRPMRPGDHLSIHGRIKALLPHRAGTHALIRLEAKDAAGLPVFTETIGAMLRGVSCREAAIDGELSQVPEHDGKADILWTSDIPISPERPYVYDGCTGIEFPIHTSPAFARMVGLPGVILQGTATLAYAVRELVNQEAGRDPERVAEIACRFSGMVRPGTDIKVCCTGKKKQANHTDVFFEVLNENGEKAIRNGYMKIKTKEIK